MVSKTLSNLPKDVQINFNFFPRALPTRAARKLEHEEMISEVLCALNVWYYTGDPQSSFMGQ